MENRPKILGSDLNCRALLILMARFFNYNDEQKLKKDSSFNSLWHGVVTKSKGKQRLLVNLEDQPTQAASQTL